MATNLGTAVGRIVIDAGGVGRGVGAATRSLGTLAKIGGPVAAVALSIASVTNAASKFEAEQSRLRAVIDATGKQFGLLRDQALAMGEATSFSAGEAAQGQTELAKAGLTASQILGGGLQAALALAAAGEIDLATAATTVSSAMNQFQLPAQEATRVADIMANVANKTATDVGELSAAFSQGGAAASASGLPIQDFAAILGVMADEGTRGSDAGTSFKAAVSSLVRPIGQGEKAVAKYNLEFFKANGEIKNAAGISQELNDKLGGLNRQQRLGVLQSIAGRDGYRALLAVYNAGPKVLTANAVAYQKAGSAADTARIKQDNLRGDVEKLGGSLETLQIKAGTAFQPLAREGVQAISALLTAASNSQGLADFGQGLFDLGAAVGQGIAGMAPLASAIASVASGALAIAGPMTSTAAALVSSAAGAKVLTLSLVALAAGFTAMKVAAIGAMAATKAGAILGAAGAFVRLAATVRTAAAAYALLSLAMSGPAIIGVGVAVLAAGVYALATGMFAGKSSAEQLAEALASVNRESAAAAAGLSGLTAALGGIKDANIAEKGALLNLRTAQADLTRVRASGTASALELAQAEHRVTEAARAHDIARQRSGAAQTKATAESVKAAIGFGRLTTEIARGKEVTAEQINSLALLGNTSAKSRGQASNLANALNGLTAKGASTAAKMNVLRDHIRQAADAQDKGTASGRKMAAQLGKLASLDNSQITKFAESVQTSMANGVPQAKAFSDALKAVKPPKGVKLDVQDAASPKVRKAQENIKALPKSKETTVAAIDNASGPLDLIRGKLDSMPTSKTITVTTVPVHKKGSWTVQETIEALNDTPASQQKEVRFKPAGTFGIETMLDQVGALDVELARLDAKFATADEAREKRRLVTQRTNAQKALNNAKADDKAAARERLADARRAVAEFDRTAATTRKRGKQRDPVQARRDALDAIGAAQSDLSSAMSEIGSRATDAIDRGLSASVASFGARLKATLAAIDNGPEAQRIGAIDAEMAAFTDARDARGVAKQRGELTKTATDADALVARRSAGLAGARTESERQAGQALLDAALAEQAAAQLALVDFAEEQRQADLAKERAALATSIEQKRAAAQTEHDNAVAAATLAAETRKAELARSLADLQQNFTDRKINVKQFNAQLAAILGDPALAADLNASGKTLGVEFAKGIDKSVATVEKSIKGITKLITDYLVLKSPAKRGPLAFDFGRSGSTLAGDLAAGMMAERASVERASAGIASAAATRAVATSAWAGSGAPQGGGETHLHMHSSRPDPAPRETAHDLLWELRYGGGRR